MKCHDYASHMIPSYIIELIYIPLLVTKLHTTKSHNVHWAYSCDLHVWFIIFSTSSKDFIHQTIQIPRMNVKLGSTQRKYMWFLNIASLHLPTLAYYAKL